MDESSVDRGVAQGLAAVCTGVLDGLTHCPSTADVRCSYSPTGELHKIGAEYVARVIRCPVADAETWIRRRGGIRTRPSCADGADA